MIKCTRCLHENDDKVRFCSNCGAPLRARFIGWLIASVAAVAAIAVTLILVASASHPSVANNPPAVLPAVNADGVIHVGVAYGTEKKDWFSWAVDAFAATPEGSGIQIDLKPMGSLEAAQSIVHGDAAIQVWSPASALYKSVFLRDWAAGHPGENPIESEQQLALTPMVFVMWQQRYEAFTKKYPQVSFRTVAQAMNEPGGWNAIANQPDWGFFKFSHTQPNHSNSGLVALTLMACDYHDASRGLNQTQVTDPAFQQWLIATEHNQVGAASGLIDSTGTLMTAMVQRGWSTYDCVMVYESNAVERLRQANGRWGALKVIYPARNFWNDNPYYVLNVPGNTPQQRSAASAFAKFLLSESSQRKAMEHGFRPANVNVATNGPDSPFVQFAAVGLQATVPGVFCESPDADTIETLLLGWQRSQSVR